MEYRSIDHLHSKQLVYAQQMPYPYWPIAPNRIKSFVETRKHTKPTQPDDRVV